MTSITVTPITEPQKKQYNRFMDDARDKAFSQVAHVGKDQFQKLIGRGDELNAGIAALVIKLCGWQYANEEVASKYGYLSGYRPASKGITEQTNRLRELFPGIGYADEKLATNPLSPNAEGYFAIPRWEKIAPTYGEAVEKVFDLLAKTRNGKFENYHKGQLGPKYLRQSQKAAEAFQKFGEEQKDYDILVIPTQFGLRHAGRSVRRALEVMNGEEFGLGAYAIGIMLLTHPERLQSYDDLWIDCAGDEFSPVGGGVFPGAPRFFFNGGWVEFVTYNVSYVHDLYGSASGFRPQAVEPCPLEN